MPANGAVGSIIDEECHKTDINFCYTVLIEIVMHCYQREIGADGKPTLTPVTPVAGRREVIIFPGIDGMERWDGPRAISGLLKLVALSNTALGDKKVVLSGVMYPFKNAGDASALEAPKAFVAAQLAPRLGLDGDNRPSVHLLKAAMNRLTFVTHSYGGKFAQQVAAALSETLKSKGYKKNEIDAVIGSGVVIATAGHTSVYTNPQFTTLFFRAENDPVPTRGPTWNDVARETIHKETGYFGPKGFNLRPIPHGILITTSLNNHLEAHNPETGEVELWEQEHSTTSAATLEQLEAQRINDIRHKPRSHWLAHLPDEVDEHDTRLYVELKNRALCNAVTRSESRHPEPGNLLFDGMAQNQSHSNHSRIISTQALSR